MNFETALFIGLIALGIVLAKLPFVSRPFDWMETFFHELSHGLVATVTFGWMKRIKLNWDGSGYCVTRGGIRIFVLLAGYLGAVIAGMAIYLVGWEIGNGTLTAVDQVYVLRILIGLFAAVTIFSVRDPITLLIMILMICALGLPIYYANLLHHFPWYLEFVGLYIMKGALIAPTHLIDGRHVGDGAELANITFIPEIVWVVLWLIFAAGALSYLYLLNLYQNKAEAWFVLTQSLPF
ncbi:MAG: M50 family metallopeptidase [Pseudomonadota bacterium]|nr:M50 family metallopeptidase [Pseudomonadota bacterium]